MHHPDIDQISFISDELVTHEINGLMQVRDVVKTPAYLALVNWLHSRLRSSISQRLIITGVGKNAHIAAKISETMASLGVPSFYLNTAHASHGDLGFINDNDVVIHISRSGKTQEMLDLISYMRHNMPLVFQVLIHCNTSLNPNKDVDHELCIGNIIEGDEHKLAPTSSTTALLCTLDAISASLSSLRGFTRQDFLKYHPGGSLGAMLRDEK